MVASRSVEGVGGHDVRVELRAGVEVVVVGGDAGRAELPRRLGRELAEGDADLHAELGHLAHGLEHLGELRVVLGDALPGRAHAEAGAAVGAGALGRLEDACDRRQRLALEAGGVVGALGAVGAVLAAAAGLDAHQGAELDLVLGPVGAIDLARPGDQVEEGQVVEGPQRGQVGSGHKGPTLARTGRPRQGREGASISKGPCDFRGFRIGRRCRRGAGVSHGGRKRAEGGRVFARRRGGHGGLKPEDRQWSSQMEFGNEERVRH